MPIDSDRRRRGFKLIELAIVLALIAVVGCLILAGLYNKAYEAAARVSCT